MELPKLLFPRRNDFSQLFDSAEPYVAGQSKKFQPPNAILTISSYCTVRDADGHHSSLSVTPSAELLKKLGENMIYVTGDEIYFQIVIHEDGKSLVLAQYNQIIGSRWISRVKTKSIPLIKRGPSKKAKGARKCKTTTK